MMRCRRVFQASVVTVDYSLPRSEWYVLGGVAPR